MPEWLLLTSGAGLSALCLSSSALWVRSMLAHRHASDLLTSVAGERDTLIRQLDELKSHNAELSKRVVEADKSRAHAVDGSKVATDALDRTRQALHELQRDAAEMSSRLDDANQRAEERERRRKQRDEALQEKVRSLRSMASELQVDKRRTDRLLDSLGISPASRHRDPLEPEHRVRTRRVLRQLLVDTPSSAAALSDARGMLAFAAGEDAAATRLATVTSNIAAIEGELATVLCEPIASVSLMGRRFCQHLLRMPGSKWWLGVDNLGDAPLFALRRAHLALVGLPAPVDPVPPAPASTLTLDDVPDEALSSRLVDWSKRWRADAAAVLDVEGRPLAATPSAEPSSVMALRRAATPLLRRLQRDGRQLIDATLIARSPSGTTVTFQCVGNDLDAPFFASVGPDEPPRQALDELLGLLRWSSPLTSTAAK